MDKGSPSLRIFKFGGRAHKSAAQLRQAALRVRDQAPHVAVVVSALEGVTDLLWDGVRAAAQGGLSAGLQAADEFERRHAPLLTDLFERAATRAPLAEALGAYADEYRAIVRSVVVLEEATLRTYGAAASRGERMGARLFTALLQELGVTAGEVEASRVVFTERRLGALWPDWARCEAAAATELRPLLAAGKVPVVAGGLGMGPQGELVSLGRGGADLSAAVLGRTLGAAAVVLHKDVEGCMTADPRRVPDAGVVPELHYREAAELAFYGATVLHPRTMVPLMERGIPLWIRSSAPHAPPGTRVAGDVLPGAYPVRALSSAQGLALVSVEGKGMMGVPGVAARTFAAVSRGGHSVSMISQSSSEASICFVLPDAEAEDASRLLLEEFRLEMDTGMLERIGVEKGIALVSIVGLGMRGARGIAGRSLTALSRDQVNVLAIAQGSSELNITVAVQASDSTAALRALHREFQLHKHGALPDSTGREASVAIMGLGQIGRALSQQLVDQQGYFRAQLGLDLKCVAVSDQSGWVVSPGRFEPKALVELCARKSRGEPLVPKARASSPAALREELREKLWPLPMFRPILVDLTAGETLPVLLDALENRLHVVLANKRPLAGPQADFDRLFATAQEQGRFVRYEATVGAGLPVIDTLKKLVESGDEVTAIQGCFSGTLGFLMTQLEKGVPFSQAVGEAKRLGYTEPEPKEDLSGMDVARKVLILARTLGRRLELSEVRVMPLFPEALAGLSGQAFLDRLAELDGPYAERQAAAKREQKVLRYVATLDGEGLRVGLEAVPESSPIGRLQGSDNQIVVRSRRYAQNPLVVTGPGAGADVTASGVLNDLVAIATGEELPRGR